MRNNIGQKNESMSGLSGIEASPMAALLAALLLDAKGEVSVNEQPAAAVDTGFRLDLSKYKGAHNPDGEILTTHKLARELLATEERLVLRQQLDVASKLHPEHKKYFGTLDIESAGG